MSRVEVETEKSGIDKFVDRVKYLTNKGIIGFRRFQTPCWHKKTTLYVLVRVFPFKREFCLDFPILPDYL